MSTCMWSDCTCHFCSAVLPLPHFVLPVHHFYSSSAGSWKDSSGTLLSVCVKGFRPAAWRHFAHPPLSSSDPPSVVIRQLRRYTAVACGCVWLCMCGAVTVYTGARRCNTFMLRGNIYCVCLFTFFLFLVGALAPEARVFITTTKCHKRTFSLISEAIDPETEQ